MREYHLLQELSWKLSTSDSKTSLTLPPITDGTVVVEEASHHCRAAPCEGLLGLVKINSQMQVLSSDYRSGKRGTDSIKRITALCSSHIPAIFQMDRKLEVGKLSGNKTKGEKKLPENTTENWEQFKYTLLEECKYLSVLRETCANGQYFQSKIDKITNIFKERGKIKCNS